MFIFCEGKKREAQYFRYFQGIDSRINIVVHPMKGDEDNSPTGLYRLAAQHLIKTENNPYPTYELLKEDEVWFVVDTDSWGNKVAELRSLCQQHPNWKIAQSNPCFEVWLYFHSFENRAVFQWLESCNTWKAFLTENIPGGFNSNKHPIYIGRAIEYAERNFLSQNDAPEAGCTEVFRLAKVIYLFCRRKIEGILNRI